MKAKMVRSGRRLVILAAAALAILPSGAAVYLRADAPEEYGDGRSWSSAVRTVAAAFRLLASEPDTQADRTLYVARGVYSTSGLSSDKTTTNQFASIAVYGYQEIRIIRKVGFALSGRRRGRVRPRPVNIG